jgi:predicted PurR-regulated permease PerM
MGLLPHVLHHVGFFVGTALIAGSGGTAIFGLLGLLLSLPMLMRLKKRFGTWKAPALALAIFAVMFAISTYVIGPAMSGSGNADTSPASTIDHKSHHR